MAAITNFSREFHFLSNFHKNQVEYEGLNYPTSEHAFQAAKTFDPEEREKFTTEQNPAEAKKMGGKLKLRPDWEEVKYEIMTAILRNKFNDEKLRKMLLETGERELIEENMWHDNFWGVCLCEKCGRVGKNSLGEILEKVRGELKQS